MLGCVCDNMTIWVHNSQCQPYEVDSLAVPMMRTCWIFALSSQCGIFTTMIVEGLQIVFGDFLLVSNLDLWWSQWISESSAQENMKTFHGISSRGMNCMTKSHSFHRHVCLLAFFVLCASTRMALFCSPCDEYFAEYFYWSRSAESLPPWSLRACELIWRCFGCLLNVVFRKWQDRVFEFGKMLKDASQSRVLQCHRFSCFCVCDLSLSMSLRLEHLEHFAIVAGKVRANTIGGVFFWHFFLFFCLWSWLLVASVAFVASWLLWLLRSWLLVAPGGCWWLLVAPGGSWWLLVAPVAPGGFCGFRGSWWLLVASVASAASVASMASMAPMAHLSSIGQSISEACSPGACFALDTPWVSVYLSIYQSIYQSINLST